jgi:general L-amino acid transport system permease protein
MILMGSPELSIPELGLPTFGQVHLHNSLIALWLACRCILAPSSAEIVRAGILTAISKGQSGAALHWACA